MLTLRRALPTTGAAAHQFRAIASRLLALTHLLPVPPAPELEALTESATVQTLFRVLDALGASFAHVERAAPRLR